MGASHILDKLQRVRQTKPGAWMAACPCCESRKGRPLAVTEASDGRTLIHAFCGCSTDDVLGRIGLAVSDLFEKPLEHHIPRGNHPKIPASDVLEAMGYEASVLAMLAADFLATRTLSEDEWRLLSECSTRLAKARDYLNGRAA